MEENQNLPHIAEISKVMVDLKQTSSGRWHIGSFRINVDSAEEFAELFDKVYEQVDKRLISLNKGVSPIRNSSSIVLSQKEEIIFSKLRKARMEASIKEGFPPYVIFHDSTLKQIARQMPTTPEALKIIIGEKKFEKYGAMILNNILKE
jgi:superfamily II DNA helicase RecQ